MRSVSPHRRVSTTARAWAAFGAAVACPVGLGKCSVTHTGHCQITRGGLTTWKPAVPALRPAPLRSLRFSVLSARVWACAARVLLAAGCPQAPGANESLEGRQNEGARSPGPRGSNATGLGSQDPDPVLCPSAPVALMQTHLPHCRCCPGSHTLWGQGTWTGSWLLGRCDQALALPVLRSGRGQPSKSQHSVCPLALLSPAKLQGAGARHVAWVGKL